MPYDYNAVVVRVIDGDTVDLLVDLGFKVQLAERFRLLGINAPELHASDPAERARGVAAAEHLSALLPVGAQVQINTRKGQEKFGRWLATAVCQGVIVNQRMIDDGHAVAYDGGKR